MPQVRHTYMCIRLRNGGVALVLGAAWIRMPTRRVQASSAQVSGAAEGIQGPVRSLKGHADPEGPPAEPAMHAIQSVASGLLVLHLIRAT